MNYYIGVVLVEDPFKFIKSGSLNNTIEFVHSKVL